MCQKVHKKLVPASDQGAFLMMFDNFFIQIKLSKTSFTYFFYFEYYLDILEKNDPGVHL